MIILITGGARSGKSGFSEELAVEIRKKTGESKNIAYIATSEIYDEEFKKRIAIHKQKRPAFFTTYEECLDIHEMIKSIFSKHNVFIIECLTTWLGNIFYKNRKTNNIEIKTEKILNEITVLFKDNKIKSFSSGVLCNKKKAFKKITGKIKKNDKILLLVSNELGLGIIPENKDARIYRDIHGRINQKITGVSSHVFFLVSGIPLKIK